MGLWIGLHFAELPLALVPPDDAATPALAVVTTGPDAGKTINANVDTNGGGDDSGDAGRPRVLQANAAAAAAGVVAGMPLSAARALLPTLVVHDYDPEAERAALERLAAVALCYTGAVSLAPPRTLLLDSEASLRLFHGLDALCRRLQQDFDRLGHRPSVAAAPTPGGAELLAGLYPQRVVDRDELLLALTALPVGGLVDDACRRRALAELGVTTFGALLQLPRASLQRRFGGAFCRRLQRLLGELPDLRPCFRPPPQTRAQLALPYPVAEVEPLLFALRRLLRELAAGLRAQQRLIGGFTLRLASVSRRVTAVPVELARPGRDLDHWQHLLRERLYALALDEPVAALELSARHLLAHRPVTADLFDDSARIDADLSQLAERLQARLGEQSVHALAVCDDHRPERAWARLPPHQSGRSPPPPTAPRPLWLRPEPLALPGGPPPLWRLQGPERIESGCWDDDEVSRDYYRAHTPDGRQLWLFRERRGARGWYVHGHFA